MHSAESLDFKSVQRNPSYMFMRCTKGAAARAARNPLMSKATIWLGVAIVACWAILWLSVKIATAAVHLLLLLGLVFIIWGLVRRPSRL